MDARTGKLEETHSRCESVLSTEGAEPVVSSELDQHRSARGKIDRYELVRTLGDGGFGVVYQAYDPNTNRLVAIKVARRRAGQSLQTPDEVLDEARAVGQLDHPGLVRVYDADKTEEGSAFIVMELVDGGSLREHLRPSQSIAALEACEIIGQAAEAIHHAHRKGFVHRDLKPENILIARQDGTVKVADFGLALHDEVQRTSKVPSAGTVSYMAPEQIRGETNRLDGRTDIWALGVILYETLTGERPFRGGPLQIPSSLGSMSSPSLHQTFARRVSRI
jgi:serine/threonine-protein kinase